MVEQERLALFYFWREVWRRMNIKDIPETCEALERYNVEYERWHYQYSDANRRVGQATRNLFLGWFLPPFLYPLGAPFIYALLDKHLLEAFGFPAPPAWLRKLVEGLLKLRARLMRLLPERQRPRLRTEMKHRSYPNGYRLEELGPPHPGDRR
jgi:hypothetical protein